MQSKIIFVVIVLVASISVSYAENRVAGHWEGHIEIPGQSLAVKVDLAVDDSDWSGTIKYMEQTYGISSTHCCFCSRCTDIGK